MYYELTEPLHFQASKDRGQKKKKKNRRLRERKREANMPKSLHNLINALLGSGEQPHTQNLLHLDTGLGHSLSCKVQQHGEERDACPLMEV